MFVYVDMGVYWGCINVYCVRMEAKEQFLGVFS